MRTAVIIPSLNSPIVDRVVAAVLDQTGATTLNGIYVVGRDEANLLPRHEQVHLVDTGQPVPPGEARNCGLAATNAELLIFLDADCLPQPGWLAAHRAAHDAGHPVVGGGVMPVGKGYWHLSYNLTLFHEVFTTMPAGPRPYLPTLNLSVERRVVDTVGPLNADLPRAQDIEWSTRMRQAGFMPYFAPTAAVRHAHDRHTLTAVWRDCARSGQYMRAIRLRYPELLQAPGLLRYRTLVRLLSPAIAAWATARIVARRPAAWLPFAHTLPAIYVTKIAWCWGAGRPARA